MWDQIPCLAILIILLMMDKPTLVTRPHLVNCVQISLVNVLTVIIQSCVIESPLLANPLAIFTQIRLST